MDFRCPTRRQFCVATGASLISWPAVLQATQPGVDLYGPKQREAVRRGLVALASRVQPDGSFGQTAYQQNLAVVSLGGLAFLASGHLPKRGPHGKAMANLVDFVLQHAQQNGLIGIAKEGVRGVMYGHGFSTLFLSQIYGLNRQREVRPALENAVDLIVSTQNEEGGWRYGPTKKDADISVTVCQTMALRAARNAGLFVPTATIQKARDYVLGLRNEDGGFRYVLAEGESAYPRTAAAVVALKSLGLDRPDVLNPAAKYLMNHIPMASEYAGNPHYFYGQYYAAHALWALEGTDWPKWYKQNSELLLRKQTSVGEWEDETVCNEYATAMACLILCMPGNVLPILRR